ncbi:Ligand-gated ion channel [Popillia japonica]|uniref:Ligand-gated ion channel n=1 Tax=Popillia japonica TaxID=7064 RepID=A0AAW1LA27_POPJA
MDILIANKIPAKVFGLLCQTEDFIALMKKFSAHGYFSQIQDINNFQQAFTGIDAEYVVYLLDLNCAEAQRVLIEADNEKLFSSPHRWIITNPKDTTYYENLSIFPDSDMTLVTFQSTSNDAFVQKVYRPSLAHDVIYESYGFWNVNYGLNVTIKDVFSANRRKNLFGTVLKSCLVITHNNSMNHLLDKRDRHIDTIAKVNYVFILHIRDLLNVKMLFSIQATWGYKNNKSEWSGMIGELTRKEADIGGTPLFLTIDRVSLIDYIAMTTSTKSKFVFRQPKLSYITNVFTLPFKTEVWISSVTLVIIISIGLYLVAKWESQKYKKLEIEHEEFIEPKFISAFFMAFGAACQQGTNTMPHTISGRIITIILFTSLMFLYASYSANITTSWCRRSSSTSIQTLSDLLHSRLQVGVDDTVFNRFYFPNATEPIRRAIYLQKVIPSGQAPRYFQIEEGVKMMRQGLFAFHMETGAGYKLVGETFLENEKCDLQEIQFLEVPDPWLAIQKNSSYKEMLKIGLRKIHESGIQSREVALLYTKRPTCDSRSSAFIGVSIVDCYPAAKILLVGYLTAICIFVGEILYYRYRVKMQSQKLLT